ncbi:MAG: anthranilate synthase component I family protein, partial [Candidatus Omnitrophica bacterium]|nr:anthranilate synthase component I family protein [Candidatus Omnitrophota bacterium]
PDSVFVLTDTLLVFDHVNHTIKIVTNIMLPAKGKKLSPAAKKKLYQKALRAIERLHDQLNRPVRYARQNPAKRSPQELRSNFTRHDFCSIVRRAKHYIRQGDVIQVVLSQRFHVPLRKEPFDVYRSLRSINPSPYMFFLKYKEAILVGASPEMLVRCENGCVETMPIAGTRPRGASEEKDALLAKELLSDPKEKAEHLMLVDLGRNDLGRVCKPGQVRVGEFMKVEKYSHVMHLVSEVKGKLKETLDCFDALRACFPAGTVSGSPKIRAMEIVDELENTRRGPYAGCVGYFSFSQNMDTCITLRTIMIKGATAYVQAGAGIVADSVPEREYQETVNKAKALFEALTS